eukprot:356659-Chlamydomonas_euryale.AAC.5
MARPIPFKGGGARLGLDPGGDASSSTYGILAVTGRRSAAAAAAATPCAHPALGGRMPMARPAMLGGRGEMIQPPRSPAQPPPAPRGEPSPLMSICCMIMADTLGPRATPHPPPQSLLLGDGRRANGPAGSSSVPLAWRSDPGAPAVPTPPLPETAGVASSKCWPPGLATLLALLALRRLLLVRRPNGEPGAERLQRSASHGSPPMFSMWGGMDGAWGARAPVAVAHTAPASAMPPGLRVPHGVDGVDDGTPPPPPLPPLPPPLPAVPSPVRMEVTSTGGTSLAGADRMPDRTVWWCNAAAGVPQPTPAGAWCRWWLRATVEPVSTWVECGRSGSLRRDGCGPAGEPGTPPPVVAGRSDGQALGPHTMP